MAHLGTQDGGIPPSKRWDVHSTGAIVSVLVLMGMALGGSLGVAVLILRVFVAVQRIEFIGAVLLAALVIVAIGMSIVVYEIIRPKHRDRHARWN